MSATLSISETQVFTALRSVLGTMGLVSSTDGQSVPIIRGQVNRVPEPTETDFIVMWPLMRHRLAYNSVTFADNIVVGAIASNVLTVSAVTRGTVPIGQVIYGDDVTDGCRVLAQLSGSAGGIGTYSTSTTSDVPSGDLYIGTQANMMATELTIQVDVHGLPGGQAGDNAQRIATLMQSQFGVSAFIDTGYDIAPLYAVDPRMIPFENDQRQTEERWVVDVALQINPMVTTTQQFADALEPTTIPADLLYPVE